MANLYCDNTNGNDANPGTIGSPKKTLQAVVDIATGGDTINIANTSAQPLSAAITFNTGFTVSANSTTTFQSWDNGGSLTIQRPDEASARIGAEIAISGSFTPFLNAPTHTVFKNLKFTGATGTVPVRTPNYGIVDGCEINATGLTNGVNAMQADGTFSFVVNNYIHSFSNASASALSIGSNLTNLVSNNYIESTGSIAVTIGRGAYFSNNIVKTTGSQAIACDNRETKVWGNTVIGNGAAFQLGYKNLSGYDSALWNNLFYNFNGASAKPISLAGIRTQRIWGYNAFFDSNAPDAPTFIAVNLTANDITGSGDPFVDSANNDFTPIQALRGVGYSAGKSSVDIGAVQAQSSGSSGNNIFILND